VSAEANAVAALVLVAIAGLPFFDEARPNRAIDFKNREGRRRKLRSSDMRLKRQTADYDRESDQLRDALKRDGLHRSPPPCGVSQA
jgi:hypothetical protein